MYKIKNLFALQRIFKKFLNKPKIGFKRLAIFSFLAATAGSTVVDDAHG